MNSAAVAATSSPIPPEGLCKN